MRVLVIDDSFVVRRMVEKALRQAGIPLEEVLQAGDGAEAMKIIRTDATAPVKIELIISDINMPIMDGLEFLEQKQRENLAVGVPVIMITTEGSETYVQRAIAAGAKGYICKPFVPEQIRDQVLALVSK